MVMGEAIREPSDAEPGHGGRDKSCAVIGLEAPLWANRDELVTIHELPGFGALHEGRMGKQFLRRFRGTMRFNIVRACDQLPIDRPDASCYQVGVLEIANPDRTIKTFCDQINEAVTVGGVDVELRVASCHFREHGSEVGRAERKGYGNPQAAAQVTVGQDRFSGQVDLGAGSGGMISKRAPGFRESGAAGGSCKQLDVKFRFEPAEPPTDD